MFVPVWEGPFVEAENLMRRLENVHIPVDLGEALEPGRARVEVPPGYVEEALEVLDSPNRLDLSMPMIDSVSQSWTIARIVLVVLVVLLIVLALVF